jgi:hypothetical protein
LGLSALSQNDAGDYRAFEPKPIDRWMVFRSLRAENVSARREQ